MAMLDYQGEHSTREHLPRYRSKYPAVSKIADLNRAFQQSRRLESPFGSMVAASRDIDFLKWLDAVVDRNGEALTPIEPKDSADWSSSNRSGKLPMPTRLLRWMRSKHRQARSGRTAAGYPWRRGRGRCPWRNPCWL